MPFACAISSAAASLYNIFPHDIINGTIVEKRLLNIKLCFEFLYNFSLKFFFILRRIERDMIENVYWCSRKVRVILVRF